MAKNLNPLNIFKKERAKSRHTALEYSISVRVRNGQENLRGKMKMTKDLTQIYVEKSVHPASYLGIDTPPPHTRYG